MNTTDITTPQILGKTLKDVFKEKYGIDIRTRYIKTVRGLDGSYYEIWTHRSGHIIPNELRKLFASMFYGKPFEELGVSNPDNVEYGNFKSQSVAMYGKFWKKWLESL